VKNELSCEQNIDLLEKKIFDILKSLNEQAQPVIPDAVHALYLLKKIKSKLKQNENKKKIDPEIRKNVQIFYDKDPMTNCVKALFDRKTKWQTASYLFKAKYFAVVKSKLKKNAKIANHLGVSLTTVDQWNKTLKRIEKL